MISRDPSKKLDLPQHLVSLSRQLNKGLVQIILEPKDAKPGDEGGVELYALVDFLPRIGEIIMSQNNKRCRVADIFHDIISHHDASGKVAAYITLPIIIADLIDE